MIQFKIEAEVPDLPVSYNVSPVRETEQQAVKAPPTVPGKDFIVKLETIEEDVVVMTRPLCKLNDQPKKVLDGEVDDTWIHMTCTKAKKNQWEETVIPVPGIYDHFFTSKKYIKHEHKVLMGKYTCGVNSLWN